MASKDGKGLCECCGEYESLFKHMTSYGTGWFCIECLRFIRSKEGSNEVKAIKG